MCSATDVANKTLPTVVTISAGNGPSGGTGSGEIIPGEGYILTNNHGISVAPNSGQVSVLFSDGHGAPATITGRDPKADLAVIKVDGQPSLPVIRFGSSEDVVVGQPVVALGAPRGLSSSVTLGIVSALDCTVQVPGRQRADRAADLGLADRRGYQSRQQRRRAGQLRRAAGVPSAGASIPDPGLGGGGSSGSIGLGFAIPVDLAKSISDEIITTGTAYAFLLRRHRRDTATVGGERTAGRGLHHLVVPRGPAAKAGLRAGDVITAIDGQPATSTQDLADITLSKKPGVTVTLDYTRDGKSQTSTVTLGAQP